MDYFSRRQQTTKKTERRRKPDIVVQIVHSASLVLGVFIIAILIILKFAEPDRAFLMSGGNASYDPQLMQMIMMIMVILFLLSILTILLNKTRHKRKYDRYVITPFITLGLSFISFVIYFVTLFRQ